MSSDKNNTYVIATVKEWNIEKFTEFSKNIDGNWVLVTSKEELNLDFLRSIQPRYILFIKPGYFATSDVVYFVVVIYVDGSIVWKFGFAYGNNLVTFFLGKSTMPKLLVGTASQNLA